MNFKNLAYALVAVFAVNVVALSAVESMKLACNKKSCQIKRAKEAKK
jgi:hypothetical protein